MKKKLANGICFFGMLVISIVIVALKSNYHVDEICSYTLANNVGSGFLSFENGIVYDMETPWEFCMSVSSGEEFNITNVWKNQKEDVHPPLYYICLNFISSLFVGQFSKWFGGIINIVFYVLSVLYVNKIAVCINDNNRGVVYAVTFYFAFCYGIVQMNSFLRMYVMAQFWVILFSYSNVKAWKSREYSFKYYFTAMLAVFLGALTHYYVIVFCALQSIVFVCLLLVSKRVKEGIYYIIAMLFAGLHAVLIFPYMIYHIFTGGYRGTEAFNNLSQIGFESLKEYGRVLNSEIFGNIFCILLFFCVAGIIAVLLKRRHTGKRRLVDIFRDIDGQHIGIWIFLAVPTVIYFLLVAKSAAYLSDRYIYPIYGIIIICIIHLINYSFDQLVRLVLLKRIMFALCICLMIFQGYKEAEWPYLYRNEICATALENAKRYRELPCVFLYDESWQCQPSFLEAIQYCSVEFVHIDNVTEMRNLELPCIIYIPREEKEEQFLYQLKEQNSEIDDCTVISEFSSYEKGWLLQ